MPPAIVPEGHAMIRGSYRTTQSWQLVEMNKSARTAPLLVRSANLDVVRVGMLRSLRERRVAPNA
jgi:hypothetical protein